MKELSIEEKAKRYDEAIKVANKYKDTHIMFPSIKDEIFPELKESEDEKIRKSIIAIINNYVDNSNTFKPKMIAWLEKQGDTFTKKDIDDAYLQGICDARHEIEKQGEQKPADKVEPKFHEGEWVVVDGVTQQVTQIRPEGFDTDRAWNGKLTFKDVHLWTIQDAEDGDVLALNNEVFIYAHRKQMYPIAVAHCFVDSAGGFYLDGEFGYREHGETISPATKEQRNTLMKAMADAGYTFDFEKKELKKIEQKPAWSEEDKEMLEDTCRILSNSKECTTSNVRWLKSLKPQSTWKPSDEQMEELSVAKDSCFDLSYKTKDALKSLYNDLKKLKG